MGIRCILQDQRGFLWLCSNSGLLRYDGYELVTYEHDPSDPTSLSGNAIQAVVEDTSGDLWIGTWSGINRLDRETDSFTRWQHDPEDSQSLGLRRVSVILEDSLGILWLGGEQGGLDRFDRGAGRFEHYRHDPSDPGSLAEGAVRTLLEDSAGSLWVGTFGGGLHRLDHDTRRFRRYQHDPVDPHSLADDRVYKLHEDAAGRLWVGTWGGGLDLFDRRQERFSHHRFASGNLAGSEMDQIQFIDSDNGNYSDAGQLLLGTAGGLMVFDAAGSGAASRGSAGRLPVRGMEDSVLSTARDREGTLWIGTLSDGLFKSDPASRQFARFRLDTPNGRNQRANTVREISQDRSGTFWIGTELGLVRLDHAGRAEGTPRHARADRGSEDRETPRLRRYRHDPDDPLSLSHDTVWSVYADRFDDIWVGTLGGGVNRLDHRRESFVRYRHQESDASGLASDSVYEFYEDRAGVLWISTRNGLQSFDRETERFADLPQGSESCSSHITWDLHEDREGWLWLTTVGDGLCRHDPRSGKLTRYRHDVADPTSLGHDFVLDLYEDSRGRMWITTHGGGLDRYDRESDTFAHLTELDGLGSNAVWGVLEDEISGDLWIRTDRGLSRLDARTGDISSFGADDGILSAHGPFGFAKGRDGEMLFGAVGGINVFRPQDIELNPHPPPVEVTDFQISRRPVPVGAGSVLEQAIGETDALTLAHDDRVISFELAALSFRDPKRNRFRYKLEGLETEWVEVGAERRFVTYTNLDPGGYTFRVTAANNHGLWNEEGRSIAITVTPPWWKTWWFRAAAVLVLTSLLSAAYRRRKAHNQALRQAEIRLHQAQKMEAVGRLSSGIAHDFNNLLTVVLGNTALLRKADRSSPELESIETASLSGKALTGQLLAFAQEEVVQPRVVDLGAVIEEMRPLLQRLLHAGVRLEATLAEGLWPVRADVGQLQRVLINLTVNANDAMPEGGRLRIDTANVLRRAADGDAAQHVRLRVRDEGVGMDADTRARVFEPFFTTKSRGRGTGLGLSTVFTVVQQAGGVIEVDSRPGHGTCFEIFLPRTEGVAATAHEFLEEVRGGRETVLLVEDEDDVRELTERILRDAGYRVAAASHPHQALEIGDDRGSEIELLITDIVMPEMDGPALARRLASRLGQAPVLFVSGYAPADILRRGIELSGAELLAKPFQPDDLLRRVRRLLDAATASASGETLLLVDDEAPTRLVTALLLRRAGYQVRVAEDGEEAIQLFRGEENEIAIVVLDSSMPDMDGRAVHDVLAATRPELPFLFCTGRKKSDFPEGFFEHPRRRLLTKPFREENLLGAVRTMLDS